SQFALHQGGLDGIGIIQRHVGMAGRQQTDLPAFLLGRQQMCGGGIELCRGERHVSSSTVLASVPMPAAATSTRSPGLSQTGGSKRAPAPVGVPVTMMSPGCGVVKVDT